MLIKSKLDGVRMSIEDSNNTIQSSVDNIDYYIIIKQLINNMNRLFLILHNSKDLSKMINMKFSIFRKNYNYKI